MRRILFVFTILFAGNASAAEIYACDAKTQSMVQCISGKECECKLFQTSLMKNDAGGYRWDCGILKPNCIDQNKISDRENAKPYDGPSSVYIDKRQGQ